MEREHLAEADRHIAEAERRKTKQDAVCQRQEASGVDASEAKRLLALFRDTLRLLREHRELILQRMSDRA